MSDIISFHAYTMNDPSNSSYDCVIDLGHCVCDRTQANYVYHLFRACLKMEEWHNTLTHKPLASSYNQICTWIFFIFYVTG